MVRPNDEICEQVPNKRCKTVPSSSYNEATNTLPTSSQQQTNEVETGVRGGEQETGAVRSPFVNHNNNINNNINNIIIQFPFERSSSPKGPVVDAQEIVGNSLQGTNLDPVAQAVMQEDHALRNGIHDAHAHKTIGVALPTRELVGRAFEEKKKEIWSRLMEDNVLSIGVWGMGGVGKTALMTHVNNQLLERPNTFTHVYWVTVSQDFSISKLQSLIAKAIKFDLSKEDDERIRATKLYVELIKKQKFVLILDDLWNQFDVEEVGIPVGLNQCKLILTTRSRKICRHMRVNEENVIKVEPLSQKEAWSLFQKELGNYDTKLEPLAKTVASECAGLPLGLRTMARSMRGVDDVSEWGNALEELKEAEKREDDMEPEVFRILRYSYNRLNDSMLQECFLYCALFPEDFKIKRDDLIEYWILEGIIMGKKSRQAEHYKGHEILNKLIDICLLEGLKDGENDRVVKMHDLIRDMALQKLRQKSVMVEAGRQLEELPEVEKWSEDLVRVSLMKTDILEISSSHSPRCPKLSTLLLRSNGELSSIADSFFRQLHGLTVLDLSYTKIDKLPDSISELVSLIALLLHSCKSLKHIPSLAKLKALKKLDLSFTYFLKEVPEGMELLSNLRYLNLGGSKVKELPTGILPNFSRLQVLILTKYYISIEKERISIKGKEVACLKKLETVECSFKHLFDFIEYMESRKEALSLCTYFFLIGLVATGSYCDFYSSIWNAGDMKTFSKKVWLYRCSISSQQDFVAFPEDIEVLFIVSCNIPRTLFVDFSLRWSTNLKYIYLRECNGIKSLLSMSSSSSPFGLLSNLQNLEIIEVSWCYKMEEILVVEEEEDDDENDDENEEEEGNMGEKNNSSSDNLLVQFSLPKLRILVLKNLPELKSICRKLMICDSLKKIVLVNCPKLKRISLSFSHLFFPIITAYPAEWWESLEWDHPSDKNLLQPFVDFSSF